MTNVSFVTEAELNGAIIYTDSYDTSITIDAPNANIIHYGKAGAINIISVKETSYHECGTVPFIEIAGGNLVLEKSSDVDAIHFDGTENKFKNADNRIITVDVSSAKNLPSFSRDDVSISGDTLVCKINDEYIWLSDSGIIEESGVKVSSTIDGEKTVAATTLLGDSFAEQLSNDSVTGQPKKTKAQAQQVIAEAISTGNSNLSENTAAISVNDYSDLTDTIACAVTDDVIILQSDITLDAPLTISASITLDLNGHEISHTNTSSTKAAITVSGEISVLIKDDTNEGSIIGSNKSKAIIVNENASLTIDGGTIQGAGETINIKGGSRLTIESGTITHSNGKNTINNEGELIINDGLVQNDSTKAAIKNSGSLTINGGKIR